MRANESNLYEVCLNLN